jgi:hypothetical protein
MDTIKRCSRCGAEKPADQFAKGRNRCLECNRAYYREYFRTRPEQKERRRETIRRWQQSEKGRQWRAKHNAQYYAAHRERLIAHTRAWRAEVDAKLREIYGSVCACCGETEPAFLTIDHVNGDGAEDRKKHDGHRQLRFWLSQQPKLPGYRMLCWNCNCGRRLNNGVCPHEENKQVVEK